MSTAAESDDGTAVAEPVSGGTLRAFRHRDYTIFWLGALVSNTGSWLQNLTVPYVVYEITGSAFWVGVATAAQFLPGFVGSPIGGHLADTRERRRLLIVLLSVMAVLAVGLWWTWESGSRSIAVILLLVSASGLVWGTTLPSWQAFVNDLVPREDLISAVSLNSLQFNAARSLGPAVAGLVIASFGPGVAFGLNAASFVFVVGALLLGLGLTAAAGAQAIERRDRHDLAYRGPSPFLVFGASVPLTLLVELPFQLAGFDLRTPVGTLIGVTLIGAVWLGLLGMTVVGTGALRWSEIATGIVGTPPARIAGDLLIGAAAAIPVILATSIVAAILVSVMGVTPEGPIAPPTDAQALILGLLAAAIVAPISEELFYRGFATTAWMRSFGARRAIIEGGLFFAFVHVLTLSGSDFDHAGRAAVVAFGSRIPVAFALGWIFVSRRSLAASIGLHATFNGLLVILAAMAVSAGPT